MLGGDLGEVSAACGLAISGTCADHRPGRALQAATRLPRLTGEPVATPWDPSLAAAMACHDVRIEEELSHILLADLA